MNEFYENHALDCSMLLNLLVKTQNCRNSTTVAIERKELHGYIF